MSTSLEVYPVGGRLRSGRGRSPADRAARLPLGYHVRTAWQGRGLATEAAAACREHARDVLGLKRLIAIIDPRNRPSQRVAEKLGMAVERDSDNQGRWRSPRRIYAMSRC